MKDNRILIPTSLRKEVLECLHSAHQRVTGMQEHSRHRLFWPGLDAALRLIRARCADCNGRAPSQSDEPLLISSIPEFPFQSTATDLFHYQGHKFLLYVDRFTAWLEIALTPRSDASTVIDNLRRWFTTFGVPMILASDGGPPFDSGAYNKFLQDWGIRRRLASAYFPQSNGRAELGVKSGKRLLMANLDATGSLDKDAVSRALLTYRNTPLQDCSISPAELLYGHKLRDHLPMPPQQTPVLPKWKEIRNAREAVMSSKMMERVKASGQTHHPLQPLQPGQHVLIQNGEGRAPTRWDRSGMVVQVMPHRQYRVKYDGSGRLQVRNRKHLKAFVPPSGNAAHPTTSPLIIVDDSTQPPLLASTPIRSGREINNNMSPSWQASPTQPHTPTNTVAPQSQPDNALVTNMNTPVRPPSTNQPDNIRLLDPVQYPDALDLSQTIPYDLTEHYNLRRGTRTRNPPARLSPKLKGKTHIRN